MIMIHLEWHGVQTVFDPENEMKAFDTLASLYNEKKIEILIVESVFFMKMPPQNMKKDAFLFVFKKL